MLNIPGYARHSADSAPDVLAAPIEYLEFRHHYIHVAQDILPERLSRWHQLNSDSKRVWVRLGDGFLIYGNMDRVCKTKRQGRRAGAAAGSKQQALSESVSEL